MWQGGGRETWEVHRAEQCNRQRLITWMTGGGCGGKKDGHRSRYKQNKQDSKVRCSFLPSSIGYKEHVSVQDMLLLFGTVQQLGTRVDLAAK